jgi:hypothetical protein
MDKRIHCQTWYIIALIMLFYVFHAFLMETYVMTDEHLRAILIEQIEPQRAEIYIDRYRSFSKWMILLTPLHLCIRLVFITFWIQAPFLIQDPDLTFASCLRKVAWAQFAQVGKLAAQTVRMLGANSSTRNAYDFTSIPFSLSSVFASGSGYRQIPALFSNFNIFELLWVIMISEGLHALGRLKRKQIYPIVIILWSALLLLQWSLGTVITQWIS